MTINGAQLFVTDEGSGTPVVLLHGGFMDSTMWDAQAAALARKYRVIRFDFRGFGRSARPTQPYLPTDDIAALLDHLHARRAAVVGLSMGGGIAIDFALSHPSRVSCLVLAEPGLSGYEWSSEVMDTMAAVMTAARDRGRDEAIEEFLGRPVFASAKDKPAAYAAIRAQLRRNFSLDDNQMLAVRPLALGRLSELKMPTLVIVAGRGGPDAMAIAAKIKSEVAGAALLTLGGSGHMMNFEQPDALNRIVAEFLSANAPPPDR
ncbi:MAG: alpha/beta fold hydrolase [Vicinamibacteria bacterium]